MAESITAATASPTAHENPLSSSHPTLFDYAHTHPRYFHSHHSQQHQREHKPHVHEHHHPISWRHLFKPLLVRQFIISGGERGAVLAREEEERQAARSELFFDLAFVALIHQLAEQAAETTSTWGLFEFVVWFYLAWSVWQDVRSFTNTSGTDDVPQRLFVLIIMALLLGFGANASAVMIECPEVAGAEEEAVAHRLMRRAEEGAPTILPGGCELLEGWERNVAAALGFYLVAKLLRILQCFLYGTFLHRFRHAHYLRGLSIFIGCIFYIPLTSLHSTTPLLILPIIAIASEVLSSYTYALYLKLVHLWRLRRKDVQSQQEGAQYFTPALNLEHTIERTNLFITLVLGEMILNVTYQAAGKEAGVHGEYGRAVLGLVIGYCLNWIYADQDGSRTFLHALRRSWFNSVSWNHLHFPFTAALILVSSAMASFVHSNEPEERMRWLFGGGLSIILLTLSLLGSLHLPLDARRSSLLPWPTPLILRLLASIILALLPLCSSLDSTELLGIVAAILVFIVVAETAGKIGAVGDEERAERALVWRDGRENGGKGAQEELERDLGVDLRDVKEEMHHLTQAEKGEDDAGVEGDVGVLLVTRLGPKQRLAYAF